MTKTFERVFLVGGPPGERFRFPGPVAKLSNRAQIRDAIVQAPNKPSIWIASKPRPTDDLLREAFIGKTSPRPRLGSLLLLFPPRLDNLPLLEELFEPIAWGT